MKPISRWPGRWLMNDLYLKLSALFTGIIIYQWINCLGEYWWDETYTVVNGLLLTTFLLIAFIPSVIISGILQVLAVLVLNIVFTDFNWVSFTGEKGKAADWVSWAGEQFNQLSPILWISLAVWIIYRLILVFRVKRSGIILISGLALLSLAIMDSLFTPIYLWDEIAWILFTGLAWLVASHFSSFKQNHPDSWRHLLDYPLSLFLPVLLIFLIFMGAGLFVPPIKPILTDPYTAWKESRGETVPSFVGDKGVGATVVKKPGDARSGYSRNDDELGGGFTFDYSPVMTVTTSKRSYWRGETKAYYNGSGWEEARSERQEDVMVSISRNEKLPTAGQPDSVQKTQVEQTFAMLREDKYPVLFGAGPISSVISVNEEEGALPRLNWLPQSWELRLPQRNAGKYPQTYSIVSDVTLLDEEALREGKAAQQAKELDAMYLQLPPELPERVRELAADITKDAATPYDKAKVIEAYLQMNFKYTNEPDITKKNSSDFVDSFLFEIREGYCDYFSSAMVVLARSAGVPARWVKGYAPGSIAMDPSMQGMQGVPGFEANPDGAGTYTIRNADAHSWVEVYFEGYGWLPFEPTAGFLYPYMVPEEEAAPLPEVEATDTAKVEETVAAESFRIPVWVYITGLAAAAAFIVLLRFRSILAAWHRYRRGTGNRNEMIVKETNRLIKYCRKKGLDHREHETVRETMTHWSGRLTSLQPEFGVVLGTFEKAMYSSQMLTQEEADRFDSNVKQIREHLG
ncbi:DUF4129 domain-containing transglutaminase family protein [Paenibacillus nasutitermitis]|uniref:Transglutaminase n=1 Tax=Paenibacillus nasutitermitis TaxID=1652958 RepID=A0A917DVW6_9BACL|nr:transglutaminase domain-containing protein [Paenibacillus nasutitermitis]GGD71894.1 transglutaminase [Paenibacillus nasutitermitis]